MAMKRCPDCGEKYSDTYKYCPFCEEEEVLRKGKSRGGRRARQSRNFSILTPVLVVLILLMAGLLIYLVRGDKEPTGSKDPVTPPTNVVTPVQPAEPDAEDPDAVDPDVPDEGNDGVMPDEPDTSTTPSTPADTTAYDRAMALPNGLTLSTTDFTLKKVGEVATIKASGGSGSYTWISQDDGVASVDENGKVTAISKGTVNIVVTDGSKKGVCIVRCNVSGTASTTTTTTPSSSGLTAGKGRVSTSGGSVNVRPSAGTDGAPIASLKNGDAVQIIRSAGDGWYEITFAGNGGVTTTGYMKGDYLQNS